MCLVGEIGGPVGEERLVSIGRRELQQMLQLEVRPEIFGRCRHALAVLDQARVPVPGNAVHVLALGGPVVLTRPVVPRPKPGDHPILRPQHANIGIISGVDFSHHARGVAGFLHHLQHRQMARILPERDYGSHRVLVVAGVVRVFAGHEHGARRGTNRRGPRIAEKDSIICQLLKVGHRNGTTIRRQFIGRDIVGQDQNQIGRFTFPDRH